MSDEPKRLQYFLEQVSSLRNTDPDVTITIVDESEQELAKFQGHKIILAVWSDVMRNLFQYEGHQSVYKGSYRLARIWWVKRARFYFFTKS